MSITAFEISGNSTVCSTVKSELLALCEGNPPMTLWGESADDRWIPHTKGHWHQLQLASQAAAINIWVRSRNCGCLVTWFCYHLIAKPGNKTATVPWPDPYHHWCRPWVYVIIKFIFYDPWVYMTTCLDYWDINWKFCILLPPYTHHEGNVV